MDLMIIESPGKLKKLRELISLIRKGEHWDIQPSVGHIRDLPESGTNEGEVTTGIRENLTPVYVLSERGADVAKKLKAACAKANNIYLATDPDREGESISWHLKDVLGLKKPIRISFNEITESCLVEAMANPGDINMRKVAAQEARRVIDRLVGYLVSQELRRQTGEPLSAGRVQSVAVLLVVDRENAIRAFRVTLHFGARLFFAGEKPGEEWCADWMTEEGFVTEDEPYFMDQSYAQRVATLQRAVVQHYEEKERQVNPPGPFVTSTLQQAAGNALKWTPIHTMAVAQKLYEQGLISYMRTDSPNVTEEAMPKIRAVAQAIGFEVVEKRRTFKAKDGAQEGHSGITPTYWDKPVAGETEEQQALYKLIWTRAMASQMLAARYSVRTAILESAEPVEGKAVKFKASGSKLEFAGWRKLMAKDASQDDDDEGEAEANNPIPRLQPGDQLKVNHGRLMEQKTKAPKRYTQQSLIGAMETLGIGRPSTFAAIMANIMGRELIAADKKGFLSPMPKGELVIERLRGAFSFLDVEFTRQMEEELDAIAEGKTTYHAVVRKFYDLLASELQAQQGKHATFTKPVVTYPCPECQRPMRLVGKEFWSCTGYPNDCKATLPNDGGKPGKRKVVELSEHKCGQCSKPLIHRKKPGKGGYDFWGCSGYKEGCSQTYQNVKGKNVPDMG